MGRSISTPSGATAVAYQELDWGTYEHEDEDGNLTEREIEPDSGDWKDLYAGYVDMIREAYPSAVPCDKWLGNEDRAIACNDFAYFGVSTYCSLAAIWVVPRDFDTYYGEEASKAALAEAWCRRIAPNFVKRFSQYEKTGTASNGESFYRAVA